MDELALWQNFSQHKSTQSMNELYSMYESWSEKEAKALYFSLGIRNVDLEDVLQYAKVALVDSIHSFDSSLGYEFKNYARLRIKGEILNQLEHYSEEQTLIRTVSKASKIRSEFANVEDDLFKAVLSIVINHTRDVLYFDHFHELSNRQERVEWQSERENVRDILNRALQRLTKVERQIVEMSYFHSMSFTQVADSLSVSKSRVSQGYKSAIKKLDDYFSHRYRHYEFF